MMIGFVDEVCCEERAI